MAPKCGVCVEADSKYKCPNCLTPYCSLPCYKTHKATPCSKPPDPSAASGNDEVAQQPPWSFEENEDESGWRLRRAQLEAMGATPPLVIMLRDDELQKIIQVIDSSISPEKDLDKAMEGVAFKQFTDKVGFAAFRICGRLDQIIRNPSPDSIVVYEILAIINLEDKSHVTQS